MSDLKFLQKGRARSGRCTVWSATCFGLVSLLSFGFSYKYPPPITFHVKELVLFVFVDVNSRVFAFVEGDKSPCFWSWSLSFALRFGFAQSVSVGYLFLMFFLTSRYGRVTYGYTIRQSLMGFGNCIGGRTLGQHTCDIDIDVLSLV
jgi:hypothetical protein